MEIPLYIDKFKQVRYTFFKWRYEVTVSAKITLAFGFACLTGFLAQVKFFLPWNHLVPITGQTFAVLLAGILLGKWGGISQCIYVGIGVMGVPWFTDFQGGISVITGSTWGYLIGFIIAAFFLGYFNDKYIRSRSFFIMLTLMLFATFVLIYVPGLVHLYFYLSVLDISIGVQELLLIGVVPFIIGDVLKVGAAAAMAAIITPKRAFNCEADWKKWDTPLLYD